MDLRGRRLSGRILGLLLTALVIHSVVAATITPFDNAPAAQVVQRILPAQHAQISLLAVDGHGSERFVVRAEHGRIVIEGSSPVALLAGVEIYLEQVAHVSVGWPGDSLRYLPARLPLPTASIHREAVVPHRFALNDTDDGYADAYLDWPGWEHKIDLLALHGINEVFMPVGSEEVYRRSFREFGYSDAEIRGWIPTPAHQPWWLLQNMSAFNAPESPQLYARRTTLAQKILARLRQLGMTPVLPGYFGSVPPGFAERQPDARLVPQGIWAGFQRPDWLDPRQPLFDKIAAVFYRHQRELFGDTGMYKMDLLHEGGSAGEVPVQDAARHVMAALQVAHPGATWVLLGWQHNPPAAVIDAVGSQHLFVVDGLSDRYDGLDREKDWKGVPYAFGSIPNFGGHTSLGANVGVWAQRFPLWRSKPHSALRGLAYLPEGSGFDPAAFAFFTQLAWQAQAVDPQAWFASYAGYRYGGIDPHAAAAWRLLAATAYAMPSGEWSEPHDNLFAARPDLDARKAAHWSPELPRYDMQAFAGALGELLQVAPALRGSSAYRHDLVDIARQALSNRSRTLLPQIKQAYQAGNRARFHALTGEWMEDMHLLDRLLGSDPDFLLGGWEAHARAAAADAAETAQLVYDQRSLITHWGDRAGADQGELHDYANRELSGLVDGLYARRWQTYFDALDRALATHEPPEAIDWFALEQAWSRSVAGYPTAASGDAYRLAGEVAHQLGIAWPD